ncbi:MAG: hypothetical protein AAB217_01255 [Chloroflexota bacterium]
MVLVDREQGAYLRARGYNYYVVAGLRNLLNEWKQNGAIGEAQFEDMEAFLQQ